MVSPVQGERAMPPETVPWSGSSSPLRGVDFKAGLVPGRVGPQADGQGRVPAQPPVGGERGTGLPVTGQGTVRAQR
jgi:hypothetical protein